MTAVQRGLFLAELERSGSLAFALDAANVSRADALMARDADPWFEMQWREAERRARVAYHAR